MKTYKLPENIQNAITFQLSKMGVNPSEGKKIADSVLRMSDYYIHNPEAPTPWKELWCQVAQVAYFFPLNYLRAKYVIEEAQRLSFFSESAECVEIGYGLGALTFHLGNIFKSIRGIEISEHCKPIFNSLRERISKVEFRDLVKADIKNNVSLCFSYSLTEAIPLSLLERAESIFIIEPSTHQDARKLQATRDMLIDKGFYAWAPCTHQEKCPLLLNSEKDWCHHRIQIDMPEWFRTMESFLPFKNKTLTFSYILMSKRNPDIVVPQIQKMRVIGDVLEENGKTKALVCRGSQREFLSLLHKESKVFPYQRGDIAVLAGDYEKKGNEIRLKKQ